MVDLSPPFFNASEIRHGFQALGNEVGLKSKKANHLFDDDGMASTLKLPVICCVNSSSKRAPEED